MPSDYGLGFDPAAEYGGGGIEEFYDYLMTPRHHQQWSGGGAIRHYGPSRYASVRPEDAAMAELLLKQMDMESALEYNKSLRSSDLARRKAADEMMMPPPQGSGSVTFTGGAGGPSAETRFGTRGPGWEQGSAAPQTLPIGGAEGAPPAPDFEDPMTRALLGAGGYEGYSDPLMETERAAELYGAKYGRGAQPPSGPTDKQYSDANRRIGLATNEMMAAAEADPSVARMGPEEILKQYAQDPRSIPDWLHTYIQGVIVEMQALTDLGGGPRGRQGQPPTRPDARWTPPPSPSPQPTPRR